MLRCFSRSWLVLVVFGLALPAVGATHSSQVKKRDQHTSISQVSSGSSSHWLFDYRSSFEDKHDNRLTSKQKVGKHDDAKGHGLSARLIHSKGSVWHFPTVRPHTPTGDASPTPEPTAALLFSVGTAIVALRLRRAARSA